MSEIKQVLDKRRAFIDTLCGLAETDPSILLVICDTGFNYCEKFQNKFSKQFLNVGVTEPFAMTFAAGLSLVGRNVWIYSMLPFVTARVHEQIRNAVVMHKTSVKILGVEGGPSYKMLGFSHNSLWKDEEVEWLGKLIKCYLPQNNDEVERDVLEAYKSDEPSYIRL